MSTGKIIETETQENPFFYEIFRIVDHQECVQAEEAAETSGDAFCLACTLLEGSAILLLAGPGNTVTKPLEEQLLQASLGSAARAANMCLQLGDRGGVARCALVQVCHIQSLE